MSDYDAIAEVLYDLLVREERGGQKPSEFHVPEGFWPRFQEKAVRYREAVVLLALLSTSRKDHKYGPLRVAFENRLFGATMTPEGVAKLKLIRATMACRNPMAQTRL